MNKHHKRSTDAAHEVQLWSYCSVGGAQLRPRPWAARAAFHFLRRREHLRARAPVRSLHRLRMEGAEAREDATSGGMAAPAPGPAPTDGFFLEPAPEPELPKGEGASKKRAKDVGLSVEIPVSPRVSCPSPSALTLKRADGAACGLSSAACRPFAPSPPL